MHIQSIKNSWPLNILVYICFSLVHCFHIQTGRSGSHCKSIASSELKLNIKRVRDCKFVFCFQIHALVHCTMDSKLSILVLHSASLRAVLKNFEFIVQ